MKNVNDTYTARIGQFLKTAAPYIQPIADRLAAAAGNYAPMEAERQQREDMLKQSQFQLQSQLQQSQLQNQDLQRQLTQKQIDNHQTPAQVAQSQDRPAKNETSSNGDRFHSAERHRRSDGWWRDGSLQSDEPLESGHAADGDEHGPNDGHEASAESDPGNVGRAASASGSSRAANARYPASGRWSVSVEAAGDRAATASASGDDQATRRRNGRS